MKIRNQILIGLTILGCFATCKNRGRSQYDRGLKTSGNKSGLFGTSEGESPTDGMGDKGGKNGATTTGGSDTTAGGGDLTTGSTAGETTGTTTTTTTTTGTTTGETPGVTAEETPGADQPAALDCTKDTAIVDPNATFAWRAVLRAGDDIQSFINPIDKVTPKIKVGALRYTAENAKFVCQLRGFASGTLTAKGSFHSPSNNNIYQWNATTKQLDVANAKTSNVTMHGYSCKGKLDARCVTDRTWLLGP